MWFFSENFQEGKGRAFKSNLFGIFSCQKSWRLVIFHFAVRYGLDFDPNCVWVGGQESYTLGEVFDLYCIESNFEQYIFQTNWQKKQAVSKTPGVGEWVLQFGAFLFWLASPSQIHFGWPPWVKYFLGGLPKSNIFWVACLSQIFFGWPPWVTYLDERPTNFPEPTHLQFRFWSPLLFIACLCQYCYLAIYRRALFREGNVFLFCLITRLVLKCVLAEVFHWCDTFSASAPPPLLCLFETSSSHIISIITTSTTDTIINTTIKTLSPSSSPRSPSYVFGSCPQ